MYIGGFFHLECLSKAIEIKVIAHSDDIITASCEHLSPEDEGGMGLYLLISTYLLFQQFTPILVKWMDDCDCVRILQIYKGSMNKGLAGLSALSKLLWHQVATVDIEN